MEKYFAVCCFLTKEYPYKFKEKTLPPLYQWGESASLNLKLVFFQQSTMFFNISEQTVRPHQPKSMSEIQGET